jgi:uncharacterized repeat protein (TIGR01451 family)
MANRNGSVQVLLEIGAGVALCAVSALVLTGGVGLWSARAQAGPGPAPQYDLSVLKTDAPDPVIAGNQLTYTIKVSDAVTNTDYVKLNDVVPANTTFASLTVPAGFMCTTPAVGGTGPIACHTLSMTAGQMSQFTLVVDVPPSVASGTVITNTATVMPGYCSFDGCDVSTSPDVVAAAACEGIAICDANPTNDTSTATTQVITEADLVFSKKASADLVFQGTPITYTLTALNNGPSDAQDVKIVDTIPPNAAFVFATPSGGGTCTTPAVGDAGPVVCTFPGPTPPNGVRSVVLVVQACKTLPCTEVTNAASASTTTTDPEPNNDASSVETAVQPVPAPLLSPVGLFFAVLLLFAIGVRTLYRRQSAQR